MCGHIDSHFQTACNCMTPFLFFTFCSHLMTPIFKMLSHLMTPFFRNIYRWKWMSCSHWMTPIFTNKWPPRDIYPKFVWNDPLYFFKLNSLLKDPFFFYSPHQMTPYFSFVLNERLLYLYLVFHRTTPTLGVVSAHPRHFHMWVSPPRG